MQSFLQTSTEYSKEGKGSKSRLNFELPRIGKGDANDPSGSIALRFHWLTLPTDYSQSSLAEIETEYTQLRRQLILLNEQAARNVERISIKSVKKMKKTIESGKVSELSMRQSENNAAIIARLRIELQQLQKRITIIQQTGKDDIETSIQEAKEQIIYLRHKNKELHQKSKQIGSNIEAGDEIFNEVRKLEVELSIAEKKKTKLEVKSKETADNLQKIRKNLGELSGDAVEAQCYIEEQLQESRVEKAEKKLQSIYRHRIYNLQAIKKNEQSVCSVKQQKYHQCLKQLEQISARMVRQDESINIAEEKHLQQRADIIDLQKKLKAIIEAEKQRNIEAIFDTQVVNSHEKENQSSPKSKQESYRNKHSYRRKKMNDEQGTNIRNSQQISKNIKIPKLRFNKTDNKKQDKEKMNQTNESASIEDQKSKEMKSKIQNFEKSNLSYQIPKKTTPRVNTVQFSQMADIKGKPTTTKPHQQESYSLETQNIEEKIGESFLQQKSPQEKQIKNEWISVQANIQSKPVIEASSDKVKQSLANSKEEEQEDQDLVEFKKSIEAQLTSPFSGLKHVDIALGQIQSSIRKHQSKSRQQNYCEQAPIEEEQEELA